MRWEEARQGNVSEELGAGGGVCGGERGGAGKPCSSL